MRRSATAGAALIVLAVLGVLAVGTLRPAERVFSTAIPLDQPMARLKPGMTVCQPVPVTSDDGFDGVGLYLNPPLRGPAVRGPLELTVRRAPGGKVLSRADVPQDWTPYPALTRVALDDAVRGVDAVAVCVRSRSKRPTFVWGSPTSIPGQVQAIVDDRQIGGALSLAFFRAGDTRLNQLPTTFERMTLFRASWMGPWFAWILFGGIVVGAPLGLAWALRRVSR